MLEHGRLWLVAQRGYAVVPDGITVESGITGRAVRLACPQLAVDVRADPDYVLALPGVTSELAIPLLSGRAVIGVLNIESERALPDEAADALRPLIEALIAPTEALRSRRTLDLSALARLFVHLGSLRDPGDIAALAAASLPRVLPVEATQIVVWTELGAPTELAAWTSESGTRPPLSADELDVARAGTDPSVVCQVLELGAARGPGKRSVVWLPLRANAGELGAMVGISGESPHVDPGLLDTAAVLAAHVAASLDASFALQRERLSAVTDPLTRNPQPARPRGAARPRARRRKGAESRRLSLLVIDCDDFKEINDRAGHEFGDALLQEVADVLSRSLPEGAEAARLGGDEFVVMFPGAGSDLAEALGAQIRTLLAEGLTDAGFPLRISAGVSTYPFDGATPTSLLRAGDQALYAAKEAGKDRVASFRELSRPTPARNRSRGRRADGRLVGAEGQMDRAPFLQTRWRPRRRSRPRARSKAYAHGCARRSSSSSARPRAPRRASSATTSSTPATTRCARCRSGTRRAYRIADFPLTAEVLRSGEPKTVSFAEGDVDPSEAFILRDLGMNALLMLPMQVRGKAWGLVELYEMRLRRFSEEDVAVAEFLVAQAERRLESVGDTDDGRSRPAVYELPGDEGSRPRTPRTR